MTTLFAPALFTPALFTPARTARAIVAAFALLLVAAGAASAADYKAGDLTVGQPCARATPHGAKVAGGFVAIANTGAADDRLVSATAEIAETTEIHSMSMKDGVMTMRPLPDGLILPAGGEVSLEPGGYHLMFIGLKKMLKKGDAFAGTLTFEKAGTVEVSFTVEAIGAGGMKHMKHN